MDCAATELSRLRVGAAVSRRTPSHQLAPKTPDDSVKPNPLPSENSPEIRAKHRQEKTIRTTGALASQLQIQLAQINRMSEAVKIEVKSAVSCWGGRRQV